MNQKLRRYPIELELHLAEYIQYTQVQIADLCWARYTIYLVPYLRLLALSILTCSPNMILLARLVLINYRSLKKLRLRVRFDLPSSINFEMDGRDPY